MVDLIEVCEDNLEKLGLEVSYKMASHALGFSGSWSALWTSLRQNDGGRWCVVMIANPNVAKIRKRGDSV